MIRRPPRSTRNDTRFPYTTLFRSTDAVFEWHGARVRRWRDLLHAGVRREPLAPAWCANWDGKQPLALPGGGQPQLQGAVKFDAPLRVHARHGGDSIRLHGPAHPPAPSYAMTYLGDHSSKRERPARSYVATPEA